MLKKRMILCLLMDNDGVFYNSRNFQIQPIGKMNWILNYLNFDAIDELILLNVDRNTKNVKSFSTHMRELSRYCFVPISSGGGVKSLIDFQILLESGADKIVVNSHALDHPDFINEAAETFGTQCVVASIDVKFHKPQNEMLIISENGTNVTDKNLLHWTKELETRGAGEIFLTSIDADGIGNGYNLELLKKVSRELRIPIIASGGVGELHHLAEGMKTGVSAVSAANIFHYIGDGLTRAKEYLATESDEFPTFKFSTSR